MRLGIHGEWKHLERLERKDEEIHKREPEHEWILPY